MSMPLFLTIDHNTYRLHFPRFLPDFDDSMLLNDNQGERFDSDVRQYYIKNYRFGNLNYNIHVTEVGSDLLPARIEAWFNIEGKETNILPDLREKIVAINKQLTDGRILIYVNGKPA